MATKKMTDLVGKRLVGFMAIDEKYINEMGKYDPDPIDIFEPNDPYKHWYSPCDYDNMILLVLGDMDNPEFWILQTMNEDHSRYETWYLYSTDKPPAMFMPNYKSIGREITDVVEHDVSDTWEEEGIKNIQYSIVTDEKEIHIGHTWWDCHYPSSLWEVI